MSLHALVAQAQDLAEGQAPAETQTKSATADEAITILPSIEVRTSRLALLGSAASASEGVFTGLQMAARPYARPGDALEMVPGMVVTQHAGNGKANQYYLRGFNLDHGTDFATFVGGVPVNMPSHAHGQGYSDLNFLIPELIDKGRFHKGPYFAEEGDFASAGSLRIDYLRQLKSAFAQVTVGAGAYQRSLFAASPKWGAGHLLMALELQREDGPWVVPDNFRKINAVVRYSEGNTRNGFSVTGMAYRGAWTSTDQIPQRAIDAGLLSRFGSLDPSSGGQTRRLSLAADWARTQGPDSWRAQAWALQSSLDLYSNFQYCLADMAATGGCSQGDQFSQRERRTALGWALSRSRETRWLGRDVSLSGGVQGRIDWISPVALDATRQRQVIATTREDQVRQSSVGIWAQAELRWNEWARSSLGLRADAYRFDVRSGLPANSGQVQDHLLSPKFGLVLGPWDNAEIYINAGQGFHSNDARGTTTRVDPAAPSQSLSPVTPLVRTRGVEVGLRKNFASGWQSTLSLWQMRSASELLFVGDAGTTEASRPSKRMGLEWTNSYPVNRWLKLEADVAWSRARFSDPDPAGNHLPGAVAWTGNLGLTVARRGPWSGALRMRYVGSRPLIEDNSVQSAPSLLASLRLNYQLTSQTELRLDVHNLFNRRHNDSEYYYNSRLAGEAHAVSDRHVHPGEPRGARLTLVHRF